MNSQNSNINQVFSQNSGTLTEQSTQWKSAKKDDIKFQLTFNKKNEYSLIRVWNYIGDRVHSMIGVRKISIFMDGILIFIGDIRKNAGSSRDEVLKSF